IIDPKRQETASRYEENDYIDEYFEHFIQEKAGDAMEEMMGIIKKHMAF
ncbi:MAG TPA: NAD-dependent deacetylase, partial [Sulfurovum sp.]|nr:NAD-dependent deacetylase [Sulfurovum sp.]